MRNLFKYGGIAASVVLIAFGAASIGLGAWGINNVRDNLKPPDTAGGRAVRRAGRRVRPARRRRRRSGDLRGRRGGRRLGRDDRLHLRQLVHRPDRHGLVRAGRRAPCARSAKRNAKCRSSAGRPGGRRDDHRRGRCSSPTSSSGCSKTRRRSSPAACWPRSIAISTDCCRRSRRRSSVTTASASTRGRRPVTRAASRSRSRRSGALFFDFYGETLFRTDMGIERGALGSLLDHTGPDRRRASAMPRASSARTAATHVLNRNVGREPRRSVGAAWATARSRCSTATATSRSSRAWRSRGGIPVFFRPTRNRFGIIGPIAPDAARAGGDRRRDRRASARAAGGESAPGLRRRHQLHLRRHVLRRRGRAGPARRERRPDSLRRGLVRLRAVQPALRGPLRHARRPGRPPTDGPTVFATQSTHKLLAALSQASFIHVRDGRGAIDHAPLQRGLRPAGHDLAALFAHRGQ